LVGNALSNSVFAAMVGRIDSNASHRLIFDQGQLRAVPVKSVDGIDELEIVGH